MAADVVIRFNKHLTRPTPKRQVMKYDPFPLEFSVSSGGNTNPINPTSNGRTGDPGRPNQIPSQPNVPQMVPADKGSITKRSQPTTKMENKTPDYEKTKEIDDNTNKIVTNNMQKDYSNVQSLTKLLNKTKYGKAKTKKKSKTKKKPTSGVSNDNGSGVNRKQHKRH